jgi:hypothetical protein
MCLTCGCGDAHRVMGKNLTYEGLREMAVENGQTVDESLSILATTAAKDRGDHQQEYDRPWDTGKS